MEMRHFDGLDREEIAEVFFGFRPVARTEK
jgi:hypothetical protein